MTKRILTDWVKAFLDYTSVSEAPTAFHFWTAIATIAGALRRNVYLDMLYFKWFPNFYIVLVAEPGIATKSTTIDIGMSFLRKVEGIYFGAESTTWQALISRLAQSKTVLELPDGSTETHSCITIPIAEFGTFFNTKDAQFIDNLVNLWDGRVGNFVKETKTGGVEIIENPWVNLLTGTTPSWLRSNFPEYMIGGGFMSRCIFINATKKRQLVAYPKLQVQENLPHFRQLETDLLTDLQHIATLQGEFTLAPGVQEHGAEWYKSHWNLESTDERLTGYRARKQGHIHKLAMVLAASQSDDLVITLPIAETAVKIVDGMEQDLGQIFGFVGNHFEGNISLSILEMIERAGEMTREQIYHRFIGKAGNKQIEEALAGVLRTGRVNFFRTGNDSFKIQSKAFTKKQKEEPKST